MLWRICRNIDKFGQLARYCDRSEFIGRGSRHFCRL